MQQVSTFRLHARQAENSKAAENEKPERCDDDNRLHISIQRKVCGNKKSNAQKIRENVGSNKKSQICEKPECEKETVTHGESIAFAGHRDATSRLRIRGAIGNKKRYYSPMHAFILAGGFATRLWPLTEKRAKPLLPIAGKPILTHLVEKIPREIAITVSTNATFAASMEQWKKTIPARQIEIATEGTLKDDEKLGALGAVRQWIETEHREEDVLLLTGDNYLGFSMQEFLAAYHEGTPLLAAYDIGDIAKASAFGTVILGSEKEGAKRIAAFEEKPRIAKTTLVSTGCSILPRETLDVVTAYARTHKDNVGGIFEEFLRQGMTVEACTFTEPWLDIGSFPAYLEAHRLLVAGQTILAKNTEVEATTFKGSVAVGEGSRVRSSTLENCILFEHCVVEDCVLRDCILDDGCVLRHIDLTGKMLRAGTQLTQRAER